MHSTTARSRRIFHRRAKRLGVSLGIAVAVGGLIGAGVYAPVHRFIAKRHSTELAEMNERKHQPSISNLAKVYGQYFREKVTARKYVETDDNTLTWIIQNAVKQVRTNTQEAKTVIKRLTKKYGNAREGTIVNATPAEIVELIPRNMRGRITEVARNYTQYLEQYENKTLKDAQRDALYSAIAAGILMTVVSGSIAQKVQKKRR